MVGMETKNNLKLLLNKQMNRQNFIKHVAIGAVALIGGGTLVRLAGSGDKSQISGASYGGIAYGGESTRRGRAV